MVSGRVQWEKKLSQQSPIFVPNASFLMHGQLYVCHESIETLNLVKQGCKAMYTIFTFYSEYRLLVHC